MINKLNLRLRSAWLCLLGKPVIANVRFISTVGLDLGQKVEFFNNYHNNKGGVPNDCAIFMDGLAEFKMHDVRIEMTEQKDAE